MLVALMGAVAYLAIDALAAQNEHAEQMASAAKRSLGAALANQNVIALNSLEFQAALDPPDSNHVATRQIIDGQLKQYRERIEFVRQTRDSQARAVLPDVDEAFSAYEQSLATLSAAESASTAKITDSAEKRLDVVMKRRAAAENLQGKVEAVADRLDASVAEFKKATEDSYASTSKTLIAISIIRNLGGMLLGFLIGQFGVARPIRAIVALLQQLASGKHDIDVNSTERKDEVGDVAKTALVFKENGLAKIRMEAEQKEAEKREAAQHRAGMLKLANDFEGAIGEIIETVSSACHRT